MKVLTSLLRVIFSIIGLLSLVCYQQMEPTTSFVGYISAIDCDKLAQPFTSVNIFSISLFLILLFGLFSIARVLEAAWNMLFCASILSVLIIGLYKVGGPGVALPHALYHNGTINQIFQALTAYEVPIAITILVFLAGWICASACGRVAITALVSFGLWYGLSEFFTYIIHQWADSTTPGMPDALHMIQGSPWIIAAVPGSFFLIYALLMAIFETYIGSKDETKQDKATAEENPTPPTTLETPAASTPAPAPKPEQKPADTPAEKEAPAPTPAPAPAPEAKPEPAPAEEKKPAAEEPAEPAKEEQPEATEEKPQDEGPADETPSAETPATKQESDSDQEVEKLKSEENATEDKA